MASLRACAWLFLLALLCAVLAEECGLEPPAEGGDCSPLVNDDTPGADAGSADDGADVWASSLLTFDAPDEGGRGRGDDDAGHDGEGDFAPGEAPELCSTEPTPECGGEGVAETEEVLGKVLSEDRLGGGADIHEEHEGSVSLEDDPAAVADEALEDAPVAVAEGGHSAEGADFHVDAVLDRGAEAQEADAAEDAGAEQEAHHAEQESGAEHEAEAQDADAQDSGAVLDDALLGAGEVPGSADTGARDTDDNSAGVEGAGAAELHGDAGMDSDSIEVEADSIKVSDGAATDANVVAHLDADADNAVGAEADLEPAPEPNGIDLDAGANDDEFEAADTNDVNAASHTEIIDSGADAQHAGLDLDAATSSQLTEDAAAVPAVADESISLPEGEGSPSEHPAADFSDRTNHDEIRMEQGHRMHMFSSQDLGFDSPGEAADAEASASLYNAPPPHVQAPAFPGGEAYSAAMLVEPSGIVQPIRDAVEVHVPTTSSPTLTAEATVTATPATPPPVVTTATPATATRRPATTVPAFSLIEFFGASLKRDLAGTTAAVQANGAAVMFLLAAVAAHAVVIGVCVWVPVHVFAVAEAATAGLGPWGHLALEVTAVAALALATKLGWAGIKSWAVAGVLALLTFGGWGRPSVPKKK